MNTTHKSYQEILQQLADGLFQKDTKDTSLLNLVHT